MKVGTSPRSSRVRRGVIARNGDNYLNQCSTLPFFFDPLFFWANALCHRDYTIPGGTVAVAMYVDHLEITNPGALQFGITPEKLTKPHESKQWNPIIANVFYRAGIIERWGTGTLNIIDWCAENDNPEPTWQEQAGSVYVTFLPAILPSVQQVPNKYPTSIRQVEAQEAHVEAHEPMSDIEKRILGACSVESKSAHDLLKLLGYKTRTGNFKRALSRLLTRRLLEMTIPDKPRSSKQKYRLTEKGKNWISNKSKTA